MEKVWIYSLHDEYLGQGSLYHRDQGAEPERVWHKAKPKNNYLELLKQEHDRQHPKMGTRAQSKGIDYHKLISQRAWPFAAFTQKLAKLMGRKGGLGAFNGEEYEVLKKAYNRMAELNKTILVEAWEKATQKTIPHLLYQLQIIKDRKENR